MKFTNVQDLFDAINSAPTNRDFLTVTHVSPSSFTEIDRECEKRRRKFRWCRCDSDRQVLFITLTIRLHEALHIGLYEAYRDQLVRSRRKGSWTSMGATTCRAQQAHLSNPRGYASRAEGDSTGDPEPERGRKDAWLTLVILAGVSESLAGLHDDMRWWFSASEQQVQIVLLAKSEHTGAAIVLEKWEEEVEDDESRPVLRQSITITRDPTYLATYNVATTGGALVLGFKRLFLRDPGPGEGDFVVSVGDLEYYAEWVWNVLLDDLR